MSSDAHTSYFGQTVAPEGDQTPTGNVNRGSISNNMSTQTISTGIATGNEDRGNIINNLSPQAIPIRMSRQYNVSPAAGSQNRHVPGSPIHN